LESFFAIPMIGAVLHTVNVRLSPEQILYTINHAEDDAILVHSDFLPLISQIQDRIEKPTKFIVLDDEGESDFISLSAKHTFCGEYENLRSKQSTTFEFPDFDENTLATTFYTTGTTGDPKGVAYSHRQLVLHTMSLLGGFSLSEFSNRFHSGDVYMPTTPLFHVHGWGFPYAATLAGIKQVYPGRYEPKKLLSLIQKHDVTFTHCVPTILQMLLAVEEETPTDLSGLKVIIGGSALSEGLAKAALDRGINVFAAYGMSETCPVLTTVELTPEQSDISARTKTGKPVPMVEIRIADENMNFMPQDGKTTGEIVARSPWLTKGYVKNVEATEALWKGGYLHTGDVGFMEPDGTLVITDRLKDVIKSGGEWISSLELENTVSKCAGVKEVAAIGLPDDKWGERPLIAVVGEATDEEIRQLLKAEIDCGQLSKWAMPEQIKFVQEIPKTSVGKIDKKALRLIYT
ncbi:MAG: long-chain-fatty-acid--CoA ligase, partial [Alphaproteobacteria bacterium]